MPLDCHGMSAVGTSNRQVLVKALPLRSRAPVRHTYPMQNLLWILGLAAIALTALAAMGGLGELEDEQEFGDKLPTTFLGYDKSAVDRILEDYYK